MAGHGAKRVCLMLLAFTVFAGMMALIVMASFEFGRDFGIFKNTTGEVLNKYRLLITPLKQLYDFWYLAYGLELFFLAYGFSSLCRKAQSETAVPMYQLSMCPSVIFSLCVANNLAIILWLFLWDREYTVAALIIISVAPSTFYISFYYTCRGLYMDLALLHNSKAHSESWVVRCLVHNILGFLAAWTTFSFIFNLGVVLVREVKIDMDITCLALLGAVVLETLIWLWLDIFLLDNYTRYTISTYLPMMVVTIVLSIEMSAVKSWNRLKICVVVATAVSLLCFVIKLIFLIYRHKRKPFLKVVKVSKTSEEKNTNVDDQNEQCKNGNGNVIIVESENTTVEKSSSKSKTKVQPEQTKAIVNELHTKFEGGAKKGKTKQVNIEVQEHHVVAENIEVEVAQEAHCDEREDSRMNPQCDIGDLHSASTCGVQEVVVHEGSGKVLEEDDLPPVDYEVEEEHAPPPETHHTEDIIPVPQPMELTRENVEMVAQNADADGYVSTDVYRHSEPDSQQTCAVVNDLVDVDDNTNTSHASVEAQGSDDENEIDEIPPPVDDLLYPQEYPDNTTDADTYPPVPDVSDLPEAPPSPPAEALPNICETQPRENVEKEHVIDSERIDIDGTAKTLEQESDIENYSAQISHNETDLVHAEVHSYENGEYEDEISDVGNECVQTDKQKLYQMPDESSDGVYDSSDEGEVTLAG